jgi:uncharacterized protein (TIGR02246 family)
MTSKPAYISLLVGLLLLWPQSGPCAQKTSKTKSVAASEVSRPTGDESGARALLNALGSAASNQDADKMSSLWAVDGLYVDVDGIETKGRQPLQKRFATALGGRAKTTVSLTPSVIRFPGTDSAWVAGTATRQTADGTEPSTRFSMLLQKQDGVWQIVSATETAIANKTVGDELGKLGWLVGSWTAQQGKTALKMNAEWAGNKAFITCKFVLEKDGQTQQVDTQVLGWDPTKEQVVSWHFDANGGFGYGSWVKKGRQWVVSTEGIEQSGSKTNAMNILSIDTPDKFTWQSVNRIIDGTAVPDTEPLTIQRAQKVSTRVDGNKI